MSERNALSVVHTDSGSDMQWWSVAKEQAAMLVKTGFLPSSIKTVEQCVAIMLKGRELSVPAMYALSNIAVINGKPTCGAELMLALVHRDHGRDAIRVKLSTNEKCTVEWKEWGGVNEYSFTIQDAKNADLANKPGPWKQYPAAMLRARAISAACRMAFPGSIAGMYTPEELGAVVTVRDDGSVEVVDDPRHADYIANAKPSAPTPIKATVKLSPPTETVDQRTGEITATSQPNREPVAAPTDTDEPCAIDGCAGICSAEWVGFSHRKYGHPLCSKHSAMAKKGELDGALARLNETTVELSPPAAIETSGAVVAKATPLEIAKKTLWDEAKAKGLNKELLDQYAEETCGEAPADMSLAGIVQLTQKLKRENKDDLLDRLTNQPDEAVDAPDMFPDVESAAGDDRYTR